MPEELPIEVKEVWQQELHLCGIRNILDGDVSLEVLSACFGQTQNK